MHVTPLLRRLALLAALACLVLVMLGAFVRLSHAGLGCPDWPTCYGKLTWPTSSVDVASANAAFPERPVEHNKTWPEQVHRHLAATLGLIVLGLSLLASAAERGRWWVHSVPVVLVLSAIGFYGQSWYGLAATAAVIAELILLHAAWRWRGAARIYALTLAVIIFQALLGKWTVTWQLKPIIVTAHLLGGLTTLSLLCWGWLHVTSKPDRPRAAKPLAAAWLAVGFAALIGQIALGGWVSTNYAALACPDFPTCQAQWWPQTDFKEAFVLWRGIGVDYEGGVLDGAARATIHLTHRIGAIVATLALLWLAWRAWSDALLRKPVVVMLTALLLQISLGISNVVFGLPLWVATLHNGVAGLLLLSLVWIAHVRARPTAHG